VLWHGTSRERAEKISEHGLFHKRGLWTTLNPEISHSFCRNRSDRFGTDGAVVCLILDRSAITEGRDYSLEGKGDIYRFHGRLPSGVVEYVLVHEEIRFTGESRVRIPAPWPAAKLKKRSGKWAPAQNVPVRYSDSLNYASLREFVEICTDRLMMELDEILPLEVFSTLYALVTPWQALTHEDVFDLIAERWVPHRHRGKYQTYRPARVEVES